MGRLLFFAYAFSLVFILAAVSNGTAAENPVVKDAMASDSKRIAPDLCVELPIKAADYESVCYRAAVPGFSLGGAKLDPDTSKTRAMIGIQFSSRRIERARISLELLQSWKEPRVLHRIVHAEQLGPERVVFKGHNLDKVRDWDAGRALWFDFPIEARKAQAIRVKVYLQRQDKAPKHSS
ncbi:MAG: hypothetical protein JXM70_21920 [Pirellulales bacterium]|nr:hypothetical protein [Pirellulales bacterium]